MDAAGNRSEVYESVLDSLTGMLVVRTVRYGYDDLSRLSSETVLDAAGTVTASRAWTYDDVGNRLSQADAVVGTTAYSYDKNDRLSSESGATNATYTYDNNGNTKSVTQAGGVTTYTWDDRNRMTRVVSPTAGTTAYTYDDENIRMSSRVGNQAATQFVVDSNRDYSQVLAEYRGGSLQASYVYGLDLVSQKRGGTESFYLVDGLGSTRGLTNAAGNLTDTYTYDSFGNLVASTGNTSNSYLFAGEQLDAGTGDYYLRQRYYDASTGRFTRRDTFEGSVYSPITLNKYVYGNANPTKYIDPTGLFSFAEANAAASIGNILNELQLDYGNHLISATLSGGDYDGGEVINATIIGLASAGAFPLLRGLLNRFVRKGSCFIAGTEIQTPDGEKNIEDIEVGDWVIADDPTTPGEIEKKQVVQTFEREVSEVIDLYVDGEVITTTNEHPFWVPGTGWVEAGDLQVGMLLQTDEETVVDIDRIGKRQEKQTVYNFEVEDFHTYFVSDLGLLVHNTCGDILFQKNVDYSITGGSNYPWTGRGSEPKWENVKSKAYGHSLSDHGSKRKASEMQDRANSKGRQGQWYNEEDIILAEQLAPPHPGIHVMDFERPVGRVFVKGGSPDSAIQDVTRVYVQRNHDGTIKTSFPVDNDYRP